MIPINRSSEHAIRAMTYLAQLPQDSYVLARQMARDLDIPAPFLGKVLQPLVARGLLRSQRGRNGGFRLAIPSESITLYDIVDTQEHLSSPRRCFLGQAECSDERACPMHDFWGKAHEEFMGRMALTSLKDMVGFCRDKPSSGYPATAPPGPDVSTTSGNGNGSG